MKVKIKKLNPLAVIPSYAKKGDAGLDLTAVSINRPNDAPYIEYKTGLAIEIPKGYVGLIFPRSSISDTPYYLTNCVGVIDSEYRGEIRIRFKADYFIAQNMEDGDLPIKIYKEGDRVAQLIIMPYPKIDFEEVEELSVTERGQNGFGSTNKK